HTCSGMVLSWGNQALQQWALSADLAGEGHVNLRTSEEARSRDADDDSLPQIQ
ncbi:unnamed protein product, partial [Effrenium voratum]